LELDGFIALVSMVYAPGHKFGSRLRKACCRADNERVKDLMARGCNPLGFDGGGFSCLHYAAQSGHVSTPIPPYLLSLSLSFSLVRVF